MLPVVRKKIEPTTRPNVFSYSPACSRFPIRSVTATQAALTSRYATTEHIRPPRTLPETAGRQKQQEAGLFRRNRRVQGARKILLCSQSLFGFSGSLPVSSSGFRPACIILNYDIVYYNSAYLLCYRQDRRSAERRRCDRDGKSGVQEKTEGSVLSGFLCIHLR